MKELERTRWILLGIRDYNLKEPALLCVINKLQKINQVPEGYIYPELQRNSDIPIEMQMMLANK